MEPIIKKTFTASIIREYSCTPTVDKLGERESTMELYSVSGQIEKGMMIEWDVPDIEEGVGIGIWLNDDKNELVDYDGVFELPSQAIELLESLGINCDYAKD
jgi:hypothetical protein